MDCVCLVLNETVASMKTFTWSYSFQCLWTAHVSCSPDQAKWKIDNHTGISIPGKGTKWESVISDLLTDLCSSIFNFQFWRSLVRLKIENGTSSVSESSVERNNLSLSKVANHINHWLRLQFISSIQPIQSNKTWKLSCASLNIILARGLLFRDVWLLPKTWNSSNKRGQQKQTIPEAKPSNSNKTDYTAIWNTPELVCYENSTAFLVWSPHVRFERRALFSVRKKGCRFVVSFLHIGCTLAPPLLPPPNQCRSIA